MGKESILPVELSNLTTDCQERNIPLLVCCDADMVWGSTNITSRGEELLEYLVTTDLDILNIGNTPTYRDARMAELTDTTLCLRKWMNLNKPSLSDHSLTEYRIIAPLRREGSYFRNRRRPKRGAFATNLENSLAEIPEKISNNEELEIVHSPAD